MHVTYAVAFTAHLSPHAALAALAPLVMVTGALFPAMFEQVPTARLAMFGMDAVGAAIGGLLSFFVPILFGFQAFAGVALCLFALTGIGLVLFLRRRDIPAPIEVQNASSPNS